MKMRPFGPAKTPVAVIGQGTWRVSDRTAASQAIGVGFELGLTHIDTAELYERQSQSETMLQPVVAARHADIFLASKVLPDNASYEGTRAACMASLQRLGVASLDLYYLHWRGPHALEDTFDAMAELAEEGLIKNIGVSNFDVADLEEAESILGKGVLAANQILYHLEDRGAEPDVIPWCKQHGVAVVAYSPFGAGHFITSKSRLKVLEEVAQAVGKTPRQVALAFLTREKHVFAIPKTERVEHVTDNAGGDFDLPWDAVAKLDAAFPVEAGLRTI